MKSKKRKVYCILGLVYFLAVVFVMNDAWLYQTPIAKLTKVETRMTGEGKSTRGTKEKKYEQNIQGVVLNGKNKGKKVSFSHEYTYTGMLKQGYHKGEKVFLNGSKDDVGSGIRGVKRDTEIVFCPGELHGLVEALQGFGVAVEGHQHLGFGGEEASQAVAFQKGEVQALEAVEVAVAAFKVY